MPVPPATKSAVRPLSSRERAAAALRTAILDGTLRPGERLNDQELVEWLEVSRVPLRAAIHDLVDEGLIETRAQSHTRVATPDPSRLVEYTQTIGALLGGVARITVPGLDETRSGTLVEHALDVRSALEGGDTATIAQAHLLLIQAFLDACSNPVLTGATRTVLEAAHFHASRSFRPSDLDLDDLAQTMDELVEAVRMLDGVRAELALEHFYDL